YCQHHEPTTFPTRRSSDLPEPANLDLRSLTDRELHVFKSVGAGKSTRQIAAELNLSVKTIETYREHIKYKLGLSTGAQLVHYARSEEHTSELQSRFELVCP